MTNVNVENVRKWVDALRSGNYEQTDGQLRKEDDEGVVGFCCLGVACDISELGTWDENDGFRIDGVEYYDDEDGREPDSGYLPIEVADWLGVFGNNPVLKATVPLADSDLTEAVASNLNDLYHLSFEQIADAIERTYLSDAEA